VQLERWPTARIARVPPLVTVEARLGCVELYLDVERTRVEAALSVTAQVSGVHLEVPDPAPWWPRGYGEQPLYEVGLELHCKTALLDT
jgi:beta-mannosidase